MAHRVLSARPTLAWESYTTWGGGRTPDPREGIWEVATPDAGWNRVAVTAFGWVVYGPDDQPRRFQVAPGDADTLTFSDGKSDPQTLTAAQPDADDLVLTGTFEGHAVSLSLHRVRGASTTLVDRGFHWVNEVPYNR